jgi:imidazolonepropionase-like amidohydrolase
MHRLRAFVATTVSCFALVACSSHAPPDPPSGLVVSNVTVVSPERTQPLEHTYVRIIDGRIAEVSERPLSGADQIDGTGRYLIPGLIDSHVHLAVPPGFPSSMTAEQAAAHPDLVTASLAQDPRSYLFYGFTTLLDLIGSAARTRRWNALEVRPDAYFCGAVALNKGRAQPFVTPMFSYPRVNPAPAEQTVEAAVTQIASDGASCVKTFYWAPGLPLVSEARALVAAAHQHGLPVLVHANSREDQAFAVATGVDVIVHGMWNGWQLNNDGTVPAEVATILGDIARENIGYQPTFQVVAGLRDMIRSGYLAQAELANVYPAALIDWYASKEASWYAEEIRKYPGFRGEAGFSEGLDRGLEAARILTKANANLLFGSDTPSDRVYTNPPGFNGRQEMNNWIAAGISETRLFRALTIDNARMLRLDKQIGTVEPGKTANLLILRANPLESVKAYDTIETVLLHGRPISRAALSASNASNHVAGSAGKSSGDGENERRIGPIARRSRL